MDSLRHNRTKYLYQRILHSYIQIHEVQSVKDMCNNIKYSKETIAKKKINKDT